MIVTVPGHDLGVEPDLDVLGSVDALDEIPRHRLLERIGTYQHDNLPGVASDVQRRLACGVGGAADVRVVALPRPGFIRGRAVVYATSGELAEPRGFDHPVRDAGRDHHRPRLDLRAVAEEHGTNGPAHLESGDVAGKDHLGAEAARLGDRPMGEVGAAQAPWESEVVLDGRALTGLSARRFAFDDDGLEPLRRAVDGGGHPCRSTADDAEVV